MKETAERVIKVGFRRKPADICDEIESVSAEMIRSGFELVDSLLEDSLARAHLFFERTINENDTTVPE